MLLVRESSKKFPRKLGDVKGWRGVSSKGSSIIGGGGNLVKIWERTIKSLLCPSPSHPREHVGRFEQCGLKNGASCFSVTVALIQRHSNHRPEFHSDDVTGVGVTFPQKFPLPKATNQWRSMKNQKRSREVQWLSIKVYFKPDI
ncbi:hypothetical protein, unlikely [Trypanosoma brucei gambiense DAL972]|uniref:Uncharacterized protein n=1 Tax=Trypanosoma brucei gambiense (strain MHOM/CI/86/DAL972) TaxID=679716 RepID=C9ZP16_TRYB9|nr:hypothetical protein, unlikely [Trypanosoma brucei gambiense DAL972]CBH11144.1 hypothetical protein, unlikely [Trypanosoma brucei gambiense DAL972]|eukprot:XP_011773431.1 hypothetical protein, unlikely [Trypanosoma brucei gambiense DAL972]